MSTLNFSKIKSKLPLIAIFFLAATLRLYGIDWDQGNHLHPDERMITMVAGGVHLPQNESEFNNLFTSESSLNPKFFAYGSFPIYLLKAFSLILTPLIPSIGSYDEIIILGRILSTFFDLGIIWFIYKIGEKVFSQKVALLCSLFYTLSVLTIQLSHFYAVDTPLTFFITLTLYRLILYAEEPNFQNLLLTAISWGLSLATKTSALTLIFPIFITLLYSSKLLISKSLKSLQKFIIFGLVLVIISLSTFAIAEPFALIDFQNFLKQTQEQQRMTADAFTFPYTLQYVGKIPYFYELKNIWLWGMGPIIASFSFLGIIFFTYRTFLPSLNPQYLILTTFFWVYFLVVGRFAIGFMRYMLPLYPILCLCAAYLWLKLDSFIKFPAFKLAAHSLRPSGRKTALAVLLLIALLIWPVSFLHIYSEPNTRVKATEWINQNIPIGSVIATEHWDDGLPIGTQSNYQVLELPMYEPDTPQKWKAIKEKLQKTQYIIIASHRLYVPLQKLANCDELPAGRCYSVSAEYYKKLFAEKLGFTKVKEFYALPKIPLIDLEINDFSADESFTVYDHPKVMVFKKI